MYFVKLTSDGESRYINLELVTEIIEFKDGAELIFRGGDGATNVSETPEQILSLPGLRYK